MSWRLLPLLSLLVAVACGAPIEITPAMVDAAKKRSPDATHASLDRGQTLFDKRCTKCHRAPDPKAKSAEKWPSIVRKMAKRAKLAPDEERDVLDYILAVHDAAE
jgi:cytochrome c5